MGLILLWSLLYYKVVAPNLEVRGGDGGGRCHWHMVGKTRDAAKYPTCTEHRTAPPQVSTVPRLRMPAGKTTDALGGEATGPRGHGKLAGGLEPGGRSPVTSRLRQVPQVISCMGYKGLHLGGIRKEQEGRCSGWAGGWLVLAEELQSCYEHHPQTRSRESEDRREREGEKAKDEAGGVPTEVEHPVTDVQRSL